MSVLVARTSRLGIAAAILSLLISLLVAVSAPADAQTPNVGAEPDPPSNSDIIDNGTVQLGVHDEAHLNVRDDATGDIIGLTYLPTGNESTAPGCTCEGWGAGDVNTNSSGYANDSVDGVVNLDLVGFTSDGVNALSIVDILEGGGGDGGGFEALAVGDPLMRVTHNFHPSPVTDNLYEVTVTIENRSPGTVDPVYRRVMDWDIEPTPFDEFSTIEDFGSGNLLYSSTNGFDTANPLDTFGDGGYTVGPPTGPNLLDEGPDDHGAKFDFGFDPLTPFGTEGDSVTFNIYYGAAGTEEDALNAIASVGAEVYSFGQPNTPDGPTLGTPNTFIFAFSGVGGDPFAGGDRRPPLFLNVFQDPAILGPEGGPFEVTSRAINVGTGDATGAETWIELGPNLSLESGATPFGFGTIPPSTSMDHQWGVRAAPSTDCEPYDTWYRVFLDWDERDPGDPVREVLRNLHIPGGCANLVGNVALFGNGPIHNAQVQICPVGGGPCIVEMTDASGDYEANNVPSGMYDLTARPPLDPLFEDLLPVNRGGVNLPDGDTTTVDFELGGPRPRPDDVTIESRYEGPDGIPVVYWGDDLDLVKSDQCPGAQVWFEVRQGSDIDADGIPENVIYADPGMNESPDPVNAGKSRYSDVIPAFFPTHGYATIVINVDCPPHSGGGFPDEEDNVQVFTIYIDPSGFVRDLAGNPIEGATVTLFRSDAESGPFVQVPDGSLVMSPANRQNPDLTDASGHFGWDTTPGYYKVRAEKTGCGATESHIMEIPPPVTDLDLRLNCGGGGGGGGGGSTPPEVGGVTIDRIGATPSYRGGYVIMGQGFDVSAPDARSDNPHVLEFRLERSWIPPGRDPLALTVYRDDVRVPECAPDAGETATPDPCVASIVPDGSQVVVTVHTSKASVWTFGYEDRACRQSVSLPFTDVAGSVHADSIACIATWNVTTGTTPTTYSPAESVSTGQMASFLTRILKEAGVTLPLGGGVSLTGPSVHAESIGVLASLGVIETPVGAFDPGRPLLREEMAAWMVRAYKVATDVALPVRTDRFSDDEASPYEDEINAAAGAGLTVGVTATTFDPSGHVSRDQMASFLVNLLDVLVSGGSFGR